MKKLDILFYIYGMDGGGAERHVLYLLQRLDRSRFSPRLFLKCADGPYLSRVPADVPVESEYGTFEEEARTPTVWKELRLIRGLARHLRERPPDLIYGRMYSSVLVAGLAKLWGGCRSPLVASEGIFPSVGIVPDLGRFKFPRLYFVRKVQRDISAVIVCTAKAMVEDSVTFYRCRREKMRVIPNGLDIDAIDRLREEPPGHPWGDGNRDLVVAVGRLCPQKGFDVLLEAFAPVAAVFPSARLVVLGKGSDREALVRQAAVLGIADRVDFPGWMANPYALLSRAAVFTMSSRYEGFPNALLEAMACGVPAIATDCPSGPSEILEGEVGILVPMNDATKLSDAMRKVLEDPALRNHLAREGRRRVEERYSLDRMVAAYERLFEEVVESVSGRGLRADRKIPEIRSSSSE